MRPSEDVTERSPRPTWAGFVAWVVLGAVTAFGCIVFPTLAAVPILAGMWLAVRRPTFRGSSFGALTGAGMTLLYVAYVQRRGPGTVCWHTATSAGCDEYLNPWPWLIAGLALVAAGLVAHVRRMRSFKVA